jgi:predicted RNA binding protein YcfA (HicA-like mRNA interferase family)
MPISGKDLKREFEKAGWSVKNQEGSHVKMEKNGQIAIIPMHRELKRGLEHALRKRLKEVK